MKRSFIIFGAAVIFALSLSAYAQDTDIDQPSPSATPTPSNLTAVLEKNLNLSADSPISREIRKDSYAKLLEGQRYLWKIKWSRSEATKLRYESLAKNALQNAVELNPKLAEGYTALAELSLMGSKQDINEAIMLSEIAIKLDPDNFGGHRFLARLYTLKSNLGRGKVNSDLIKMSIAEWNEIGRLDPRNAEAWAFLSALYGASGEKVNRIDALRKWRSSAAPLDIDFYASIMQGATGLSVSAASTQLGGALLEAGNSKEALEILTREVSVEPGNKEAIDLLSQALEQADEANLELTVNALRQAVFANPDNQTLVQLLAETIAKAGEVDGAVQVLEDAVRKSVVGNRFSASKFQLAIGDIFAESNRTDEALTAYRKALAIRGITGKGNVADDDKDFAIRVINKMVEALRKANRREEAEKLLRDSKTLLGNNNSEIDKQRIDLLVEGGKMEAALASVRDARSKSPDDVGFLRREASILVKLDRVDEGARLIDNLLVSKRRKNELEILYDDFSNYLFLSSLYVTAGLEERALGSIQSAFKAADNAEKKQIAKLNLAFIEQSFGRYDNAEKNLREIIEQSPGYPIALNNLGYLLLRQDKNLEEALSLISNAVKIEPRNSSYLDSLGWAYYKLDRLDEAELYLRKASRFNATSVTILEHLGDVFRKRGKLEEAKQVWQKALTLSLNSDDSDRLKTKLTR